MSNVRDLFIYLQKKSETCVSYDSFLIQLGPLVLHHSINFQLQNESQLPDGVLEKEMESQT